MQSAMERSTEQENVNTDQDFAEENAPQQTQAEEPSAEHTEQEEPLAEQSEEKTEAEQEEAQPAESQSTVTETKENEQPEEMPFEEAETTEEEAEETATQPEETEVQPAVAPEQKPAPRKNYHVSLREDGKWQVKLSRGERAIKLFETQAEAIKFAKDKAKAQKGYITIHMVDGKIRRQKY